MCVPYLQILCFSLMWYPIHAINLNLLQVKGRSDLFLKLEIIKKILGVTTLVIAVPFGIMWMCVGKIISSIFCLIINTYYTGKLIHVGFIKQMKDLLPILFLSLFNGAVVLGISCLINNTALQVIIGLITGVVIYTTTAYILKFKELDFILETLKIKKRI